MNVISRVSDSQSSLWTGTRLGRQYFSRRSLFKLDSKTFIDIRFYCTYICDLVTGFEGKRQF